MKTKPEATHTPTPWRVIEGVEIWSGKTHIADCLDGDTNENAAFICRAVNSHEIMYEALQACLNSEYVDQYGTHIPVIKGELRQQIAQAIAKAEGR